MLDRVHDHGQPHVGAHPASFKSAVFLRSARLQARFRRFCGIDG
jgi:hypothetical protein